MQEIAHCFGHHRAWPMDDRIGYQTSDLGIGYQEEGFVDKLWKEQYRMRQTKTDEGGVKLMSHSGINVASLPCVVDLTNLRQNPRSQLS